MPKMNTYQNQNTQPLREHKVFNNWDVVTKGWYIFAESHEVSKDGVLSRDVCGQRLVVFRDSKGETHAMDGFCAHMGVDLGIGKVVDDKLRCFFHHWEYDQEGQCVNIPAQTEIPKKACLTTYSTREKYGFIWVYPEKDTGEEVLEVPNLEGKEVTYKKGEPYTRKCHYHITMINGIDPQHLKTVHDIHIDMDLKIESDKRNHIDIELSGKVPSEKLQEKIFKKVFGDSYAYSMKYADGCLAALTIMKGVKLFGKEGLIPELHMLFAYQKVEEGHTHVWPIYVTEKRPGVLGKMKSAFCLWLTKRLFFFLQGEDGEIYNNIRFNTDCLLPIDSPVAKYIAYINRLEPSIWGESR